MTRRTQLVLAAFGLGAVLLAVIGVVRSLPTRDQVPNNVDSPEAGVGSRDSSNDNPGDATSGESRTGFQAVTAQSGITFKMQFLAGEQGEHFKVNLYDHGCGVAVGDYNGDGHDDIYFCNQLGPNALYRNDGQGKFQDVTQESGPIGLDDRVCVGATFSDYDNDGDQDLYVTSTRGGNSLFQNDGRGIFRDVTEAAGVNLVAHSQTGTFFDFDLDGDLDLLLTNSAAWTTPTYDSEERYFLGPSHLSDMVNSPSEQNVCYRNNGDGTFTDVTVAVGLEGQGWAGDTAVLDFDEDGRPDLLVTHMFGQSQLLRNQPDGTFRDVTRESLGRTSFGAIGALAFDFTNDGRLDLMISDMHSDMWMGYSTPTSLIEEAKKYPFYGGKFVDNSKQAADTEAKIASVLQIDYERVLFGNTLFKNLGKGKFEEVSDKAGAETFWPWGLAAADFDNDGFQDIFIPSGMGYPYFYWKNYLLMNQGDATFAEQSRRYGIEPRPGGDFQPDRIAGKPIARSSRCAASADFDGDGRLDLIVSNFNDHPYLYHNQFPPRNFVQFRLRGVKSNRDAIGATVKLHVGDEQMIRQVNPAGGYLSHSSKTLHFGLGARDKIDRVEIRWPSGLIEVIEQPAINQLHAVTETP